MAFDVYLDTSALVKLYLVEPESGTVAHWLLGHRPPVPYSSLHELEVTHAIERKCLEADFGFRQATLTRSTLEKDLAEGVLERPAPDWPGIFARAIHLLRQHRGLRSLDGLHVGSALEYGCVWFVSFDARQRKVASAEGLKVWPTS